MSVVIIRGANLINRGQSKVADVLIKNQRIEKIDDSVNYTGAYDEVNAEGLLMLPGIIDDQVHFREPGLTHKASIETESKAAVAGGVTTFMEMPNTKPSALTQELLQDKYNIAGKNSYANYSFFMGASNDNYDEVMRTDPKMVCGVKIFMGSSTGNMLVDDRSVLEKLFANVNMLIATHCEDEATINQQFIKFKEKYGSNLKASMHPLIRNEEGCFLSSSMAIELAQRYDTRLHILHISTRDELVLFHNDVPLKDKRITSEVCVHHLYFDADDYDTLGNLIKCNPAIKSKEHKAALFPALLDDRLDIIATDHAPHSWEEKSQSYEFAPSGLPLVQHSLDIMMDFHNKGMISKERVVEKMCHAPAICFDILDRGYLDEGKFADIVLYDPNASYKVTKENIHYKCGWSPLDGKTFNGKVVRTFVNGAEVFSDKGVFNKGLGQRLEFLR
ncbi:MAG TPA: dihydroorotase [Saprospiraceae bacterium]|nr:dihydroorotase [Saprospiraceae bacterium]